MTDIQKNAVGVPLIFPLYDGDNKPLDVSDATLIELTFKKPNGTKVVKTAAKIPSSDGNLVQYVTEAGFLDQARTWQVQARIVTPAIDIPSQLGQFTVADNL